MKSFILTTLSVSLLVAGTVAEAMAHGHGPMHARMSDRDTTPVNGCWHMGGSAGRMAMPGPGWIGGHGAHQDAYTCPLDGHACPWSGHTGIGADQRPGAVTEETVRAIAEHSIAGNSRLAIGDLEERDGDFLLEIVTREGGSLVDRLTIDKLTGAVLRVP